MISNALHVHILFTNFVSPTIYQERDFDRTVGINSGHVGTSDFVLEPADRSFLVDVSDIDGPVIQILTRITHTQSHTRRPGIDKHTSAHT
jgi:hypothetical protein